MKIVDPTQCPCGELATWSVSLRYEDMTLYGYFCARDAKKVADEYIELGVDVDLNILWVGPGEEA